MNLSSAASANGSCISIYFCSTIKMQANQVTNTFIIAVVIVCVQSSSALGVQVCLDERNENQICLCSPLAQGSFFVLALIATFTKQRYEVLEIKKIVCIGCVRRNLNGAPKKTQQQQTLERQGWCCSILSSEKVALLKICSIPNLAFGRRKDFSLLKIPMTIPTCLGGYAFLGVFIYNHLWIKVGNTKKM